MLNSPADDPLVHPLVAGVEAAGVAAHGDQAGAPWRRATTACAVGERVGRAGSRPARACRPPGRRSPARRASASGVHRMTASTSFIGRLSARSVVTCAMPYLRGDLLGLRALAADQRDDLDAVDQLDAVEVLDAERAGAGEGDVDGHDCLCVLQDEVADGRVGGGHVVEAVLDAGRRRRRRRRPSRRARSATSPARCPRSRPRARSRCAAPAASAAGSAIRRSRKRLSHSLLIRPARGPCSWWLMPPVPQICTLSGSS